MIQKRIADKIRLLRKEQHLKLAQLSEITGLSKALLSRIENNRSSPPIATLAKIADALGVAIREFFEEEQHVHRSYSVTRHNERRSVVRRGRGIGHVYYSLTDLKGTHVIEPFLLVHPVTKKEPKFLFDHKGEEFLFCLKGRVELVHGDEKIRLEAGDAIHFDPSVPHRAQNVGSEESECLVIVVDAGSSSVR
ncbi:MAG: XRE family transcriptional regulator [Thermodesulfobacteriota bacterium]